MSANLTRTDREAWDEMHAQSLERSADGLEECAKEWVARGTNTYSLAHALSAQEKAETYREIARNMRRPYLIRIEREDNDTRSIS